MSESQENNVNSPKLTESKHSKIESGLENISTIDEATDWLRLVRSHGDIRASLKELPKIEENFKHLSSRYLISKAFLYLDVGLFDDALNTANELERRKLNDQQKLKLSLILADANALVLNFDEAINHLKKIEFYRHSQITRRVFELYLAIGNFTAMQETIDKYRTYSNKLSLKVNSSREIIPKFSSLALVNNEIWIDTLFDRDDDSLPSLTRSLEIIRNYFSYNLPKNMMGDYPAQNNTDNSAENLSYVEHNVQYLQKSRSNCFVSPVRKSFSGKVSSSNPWSKVLLEFKNNKYEFSRNTCFLWENNYLMNQSNDFFWAEESGLISMKNWYWGPESRIWNTFYEQLKLREYEDPMLGLPQIQVLLTRAIAKSVEKDLQREFTDIYPRWVFRRFRYLQSVRYS